MVAMTDDKNTASLIDDFVAAHTAASDGELARGLVNEAGQLAARMRSAGVATDFKTSVSDVVTDADRAAEAFVAGVLGALRPEDGVLGEEGAARPSQTGRTWVIDPVDGTYNFTSGSDYWCSALAVVEGSPSAPDRLLFGAVHRPVPGYTWFGGPEIPTTVNGRALPRLVDAPAEHLSIGTYLHPSWMNDPAVRSSWRNTARNFATVRMFGAGSVDLAGVAAGQLGAWTQHTVADWDWLPGKALVEGVGGVARKVEAGGVVWSVAGNPDVVAQTEELLTAGALDAS